MLFYEEPVQEEGEPRYFLLQYPRLSDEHFANTDKLYTFRIPRKNAMDFLYEWFDKEGIYCTTPSVTPGTYDWSNASDEVLENLKSEWPTWPQEKSIAIQTYLDIDQITTMVEMILDRSRLPYEEVTKEEFYKKHHAYFNELDIYAAIDNTYYDGTWSSTWLSPRYYN